MIDGTGEGLHPAFQHNCYLVRRKVFKVVGGAFHVYDQLGNVVMYSRQRAFKLKEEFHVYADVGQSEELLTFKATKVLDFSASYDVRDVSAGMTCVGNIRRKGLKSLIKDEWIFLTPDGLEIGTLTERSRIRAAIVRVAKLATFILPEFINPARLIPQSYVIRSANGAEIAEVKQHFNPLVLKYTMTILESEPAIDRRLLIVAMILLAGIERRQ